MTRIISIINQKGGVGKTTTAINLCHGIASLGKRVLALDLDPQSNLTAGCGHFYLEEADLGKFEEDNQSSIYGVLKGIKQPQEVVVQVKNFYLIPGSLLLAAADLEFSGLVGRELLLKKVLQNFFKTHQFDYAVIDCPPNLGLLSLNALTASTEVIIPVQSQFLSLFGVKQLLDTIEQIRQIYNPSLRLSGVVVTMFDKRKKLSKAVLEAVCNYFGDLVFETVINENVALAEAPAKGLSIFEYAPKSQGAEDYSKLVSEIVHGKEDRLSVKSA
ncbi:MAG: ParA family protein [Deltaproteobacteria bacterium]|nr:ParA family protein [Deltaproteobacteria bacterium]MCX7953090.1 ParA family protein [Deltaproteobacteria bacterium]